MYRSADLASASGYNVTMTRETTPHSHNSHTHPHSTTSRPMYHQDVVNRNVDRGENDLRNNQHNIVQSCTCGCRGESTNQLFLILTTNKSVTVTVY